jgi:hypothetical protein
MSLNLIFLYFIRHWEMYVRFTSLIPMHCVIVGQEELQGAIREPCFLQEWVTGKVLENFLVITLCSSHLVVGPSRCPCQTMLLITLKGNWYLYRPHLKGCYTLYLVIGVLHLCWRYPQMSMPCQSHTGIPSSKMASDIPCDLNLYLYMKKLHNP